MRSRIGSIAGIRGIAFCSEPPASNRTIRPTCALPTVPRTSIGKSIPNPAMGSTCGPGWKLLAGRNFFPADTARECVVNETMVKKLNLKSPADILGQQLKINKLVSNVVGVVRDFNNYSLRSDIAAIAIFPAVEQYANCAVKIDPAHVHDDLAALEKIWNDTYPRVLVFLQVPGRQPRRILCIGQFALEARGIFRCCGRLYWLPGAVWAHVLYGRAQDQGDRRPQGARCKHTQHPLAFWPGSSAG